MVFQNFLCVDLRTEMLESNIQTGESRKGQLIMDEENEHFVFVETPNKKQYKKHPELHWHLLDRSKHGRATMNARHIKVEFYIHHTDYKDGADLADILSREIESLGENLCEINLKEEVEKCC